VGLLSRQSQKLGGQMEAEKNRLHQILTDRGLRSDVVVSDVHGTAARKMVKALTAGTSLQDRFTSASKRFKVSREELFDALEGRADAEPPLRPQRTDASHQGNQGTHCAPRRANCLLEWPSNVMHSKPSLV